MQIPCFLRYLRLTIGISICAILIFGCDTVKAQTYFVDQENSAFDLEFDSPDDVTITDNSTAVVNIGFSFNFFGTIYTSCHVSENGFIQFGSSPSSGCCAGQLLPSATAPNNLIAAAWMNSSPYWCCYQGNEYVVFQYETIGTAPNRRFVISMSLDEDCDAYYSGQIKLFEGSDIIEIHTQTWASGDVPCSNVTQGIENVNGTEAYWLSGRNANTSWNVSCCDLVRFIPAYSMPQNDAGISHIYNNPFCPGPQPIEVLVTNYGALPLESVVVDWTWDDIPQTSLMLDFNPPIPHGVSRLTELGDQTFVSGTEYEISAWTSLPNDEPDDEPENDMAETILKTGAMDTFTIGGASPDFASFASAISFLSTTGVCDTVWMLVRPGTYTEQLTIPFISGATASRVIFSAENGDSSSVILQFDPNVTNRHVLKFNNAAGITWERMTINALGTDYGRVIEFSVHSFDNLIQHCAINGINSSNTSLDLSCIYSTSTNNDNVFRFNTIKHGSVGIYHNYTPSYIDGFNIHHNHIENFSSAGIRFTNAGALQISQNTITSTKNNVTGIDISGANDSLQIFANNLVLSSATQGINLTNIAPPASVQAGIYNNMVHANHASGITYGIRSSSLSNTDVYHNTIKVSGTNSQNAALRIDLATQDSIFNNIMTATGAGHSFYIGSAVSSEMDYNGYHHTGSILGKFGNGTIDVENLGDWQALSGFETHSRFYPPHFIAESDLHLGNSYFNGTALAAWAPETDIDGDLRNINTPDQGADEFDPETLDASVVGLLSPGVSCNTFQNVEVILVNLGLNTLTTATIHWTLNGDVQTPVPYTGEILPEGDTAHVTLQNLALFDDVADTLVFWAEDLNGEEDMFVVNDTFTTTYSLPLSGVYTIGGSSPDFATIAQAIDALEIFSICGPVVFSIRNGIYTEQLSIRSIDGISAANTVTFVSEAMDSSAVTIQFDATTNANYIIQLDDAQYLRFEHLGFKTMNTTYANIFHLKDTTSHITVEHCYLEGRSPTISSGNSYLFYTDDTFQGHISISNSYFLNGTRAIYILGNFSSDMRPESVVIENNQFVNQRTGGIWVQHIREVLIHKNIVSSNTTVTYSGIQFSSAHGTNIVSENKVNLTQTGDGIYINGINSEGSLPGECRVYNNMSSVVSGSAFVLSSNRRLRFLFNTAYCAGTTAASHHAIRLFGGDSITVKNNIAVANAGRAYSESFFVPVVEGDYNNFFTSGTQLGFRASIGYADLAAWQTGTGLDMNSISVDPFFISPADLHVLNSELNGVAQPVPWITTDIDDQLRDPLNPDMGADEIGTELNDAGIFAITPEMPFARGTRDVKAVVRNYGSNTLTSATISWTVNGNPQPDYYYIGELGSLELDTIILGQVTFELNTSYHIVAWSYDPNQTNDSQTSNDTLVNAALYPAVSGTVIVGATGELLTISDAVSAMYLGGIVDGVQFEIQPGAYHASITLPAASFLQCGAMVVFTSTTGNAADVIWDNTGMSTHTLQFDGADGITFRQLTIKTTINATQAIRFQNGSTCNLIEHCVIEGVTTTSTLSSYAPVLGVSSTINNYNHNNTLQYNTIANGSIGVHWDGFTGTIGLNISHNTFLNARSTGLWLTRLKAPTVRHNTISTNSTVTLFKGMYFESCAENTTISANQILLHGKRSYGIEFYLSNGTIALPATIANNYIILGQGASSYGLYTNNSTYANVYHNTIRISGGDNTGINIRRNLGGNIHYLNNILDNQVNGKTIQIDGSATPFTTNYNAHYTQGTNLITYLGTNYTTLVAWQATGRDLNSIHEEPEYDDEAPLQYIITNAAMNGSASPSAGILTDIDGMPRDPLTPDMGCDEYDLFTHDVGLVSISYPHQPYPAGSNTVYVKFINNGADTLTSMQLNWEVNGIEQPVYYWTGLLPSAGTYDSLDIGEYNFIPNFYHEIKAWVSLPNAMPDELSTNDTLTVDSLYPGLHGIYTIGGIDPDFETLSDAVAELNKGGASANVTFNIRPGTYLDTMLIRDFPGSDCDRPVIFQSESGNAEDVLITNLGINAHTIVLNGADGVIFQNLRITSVNPAYRHVVSYFNGAHCNQFLNNTLIGFEGNSSASSAAVIYSPAGLDTQNVFTGNLIKYGSQGIYLHGASTGIAGTIIEENTFDQSFADGVYAREEFNIVFNNNHINGIAGSYQGIVLYLCHNLVSISGNVMNISGGGYGMYIEECDNLVSAPGLIANNFISIGGPGLGRGIFMSGSSHHTILHNNFHITSAHSSASAVVPLYVNSCPSLRVYNNNFSNTGVGYGIYANNNTSFLADHNNYYISGLHLGYWNGLARTTLSDWQSANSQDLNAVEINPQYMSDTDLHISNVLLNGIGLFQPTVPRDIEGDLRQNPPDIGADEFNPSLANDAGVFMALGPTAPFIHGSQPIEVAIKNFGADTLTSVNIRWLVNGIEQTPYAWTGSLLSAQCDTVTIGTFTFPEYTGHDFIYWTESPNNIPDSTSVNDTLYLNDLYPALSGTYTVGGVLPDFNTFSQLESALNLGGILGNVNFSIRNGTYVSQLLIQNFPRTSASHSVTLTSESGDSSLVTLTRNFTTSDENNYTVRLKNAHGINFENLTLASTKGRILELVDGSSRIEVKNCSLTGLELTSGNSKFQLIYSSTTSEDSIIITNNRLTYGDHGIYMIGSVGDLETHHVISGNDFYNNRSRSIYYKYTQNIQVHSNTIINTSNSQEGIVISYASGNTSISGNDIRLLNGGTYGISLYASEGTELQPITLNNNYILSRNSTSSTYGLAQENCKHINYNYNTVRLENVGSNSISFVDEGSYHYIHIRNCIFSNESGGKAISTSWTPFYSSNTINHCNLYTTGSVLAYFFIDYPDLVAVQIANNYNLQGMSVESLFDEDGPEVYQAALDGDGQPVSTVTTDIYGNSRDSSMPDIGAVEFTLPAHDIGAKWLEAPQTYCGFGSMEEVTVRIQNYGANPETGFDVAYKFQGNSWITENVGALVVQPGGTVDYTFTPTVDLSIVGVYSFSVASSLAGDLNTGNDTISNIEVIHIPALIDHVNNMIPVHNAIDLDKTVSLSWAPAPNATKYDVFIWKVGDPEPITPQISNLTQINKNYSSLQYGQSYNWKVIAKNSCNQMVSGPTHEFTVRSLPDMVVDTVIAPLTGYTGQLIEVEWIVNNIGTGSTQGGIWSDAIYLSSDATLNLGLDIYLGSVQNLSALDNGMAYTNEATLTLPNNAVGNYYIFVHADRFSNVIESENGNNWSRSAAVAMIELSPLPDLDAVDVVPTALAFSGQTFNVLYTIENDGTAPTGLKTWHDRFWLTTDQSNPGQHLLGTISHTANLLPDSSYTKSLQFTVPNGIFGIYYVFVQSDFHNVIYEFAAEQNNTLGSDTIQILLNPPADFVFTDFIIPDTVSSDFNNPLAWTISNMGAGPSLANYWKDDIYISPAPVYNANFNLLFKNRYYSQVVPSMSTYTQNENSNKMLLPAGWYYIYGYTDSGNREYEYNMEGNNIYAYPTPIYVGNPDLLIHQPAFPDTINGASPFVINWNQVNMGHGWYAQKNVRTKVYGSYSAVFNPQTAVLLQENVASNQSMSVLDTIPKEIMLSVPPQFSGDVYLHFHINSNGAVYEAEGDSNNIYSAATSVFVIPPDLPDFEVTSFTIPDTVTAGTSFAIQYTTQNSGTAGIETGWDDDVYISFNPVWNPDHALKLADIFQNTNLAPEDTIHTSVLLSLDPETNENVYYIYIKTDEKNKFYEGPGESNNLQRSSSFYIKGAPVVDLAIDTIILEETTFFSGTAYPINWTTAVKNDNTPVIRSWKDRAYISTDQLLDTLQDIQVGLFSPNTTGIAFNAESPYEQDDNITLPVGVSGSYYLILQSDYTALHHDTIRENNIEILRDANGDADILNIQLSASPDLIVSAFDAPANAVVSQVIPMQVCITNAGDGLATGPWINQLYLSTDMAITSGDFKLSTFNAPSNTPMALAPDSTICIDVHVIIPPSYSGNYFLIARVDPLNTVYEHGGESNNTILREIEVLQPLPSDLIVTDVTIPLEAIAGDLIEISWNTMNAGSNPANGSFREVVYLSSDTTWSVDDPVFGVQQKTGYFPPLSISASTLTERVSDVVEGEYYAIVRTDVQQQIAEEDDDNNADVSLDAMQVDVRTLIIDTLAIDSVPGYALLYYKIIVTPDIEDESMLITLQGDSTIGLNELYVKFGAIPTRGDFDHGPQQSIGAYQHVIIPSLEVGTYYLAAYCSAQGNEAQVTELLATIVPFEILSTSPNKGVTDKQVTVEIRGIKLDQTERFRLRRSDPWLEVIADPVYVHSDNRVYATFDLTGVPLDTFQLDGVKSNNDLAVAPEPFVIVEHGESELQIVAFAPGIFNEQTSPAKIVINFINTGDVDVVDAVVEVEAPYGNLIAPTLDALRAGEGIPLLEIPLHEPNGPPGIIIPGGSGTIEVFVWSTPGPSFVVGLKE